MWNLVQSVVGDVTQVVEAAVNKAVTHAVSTEYGKKGVIQPELKKKLQQAKAEIKKLDQRQSAITCIQKEPDIQSAIKALLSIGDKIVGELIQPEKLSILSDIIGNHLTEYKSINDFTAVAMNKPALLNLQSFALSLIDYYHLQSTMLILENLDNFAELDVALQQEIIDQLRANEILDSIEKSNQEIDLKAAHTKVSDLGEKLCNELKLTKGEAKQIIAIFDGLVETHLSEINKMRKKILDKLPGVILAEKERIEKAYPELLVGKAENTVLHQASQQKPDAVETPQLTQDPKASQQKKHSIH